MTKVSNVYTALNKFYEVNFMKKLLIFTISALLLIFAEISAEAKSILPNEQQIAVVIVGSSDYKTSDFINYAKSYFKPANESKVLVGKDVQSKYQTYWLGKGLLDEGTPTKEDFIEFVNYSGYKKIIYLVIKDSIVDTHERKKGKARSRVSLTINAFLVDKSQIVKVISSTNEEDSKTSELRAKRGAFKKCIEEISDEFNPSLT